MQGFETEFTSNFQRSFINPNKWFCHSPKHEFLIQGSAGVKSYIYDILENTQTNKTYFFGFLSIFIVLNHSTKALIWNLNFWPLIFCFVSAIGQLTLIVSFQNLFKYKLNKKPENRIVYTQFTQNGNHLTTANTYFYKKSLKAQSKHCIILIIQE